MNVKYIVQLLLTTLIAIFTVSCGDDSSEIVIDTFYPKDAQIYSFSLTQKNNTSIEDSLARAKDSTDCVQLGKTNFAIDQKRNLIYNPGSLPYAMDFRTMKVDLSVNSTYGAAAIIVETPDSTYRWNSSDSISFAKLPVYISIKAAADTTVVKRYEIQLNRYLTDPDSIHWKTQAYMPQAGEQKTLLKGDTFYSLSRGGADALSLFTLQKDASTWDVASVTGLPDEAKTSNFTLYNNTFYITDKSGASYSSSDGKDWSSLSNGENVVTIYGVLPGDSAENDVLLMVVADGEDFYLATSKDLKSIERGQKLTFGSYSVPDFPLSGFASTSIFSRDKRTNKMVVYGGFNMKNEIMSSTWQIMNTASGIEMTVYKGFSLLTRENLSLAYYNDKLYLLSNRKFYTSSDWGNNWEEASDKQNLPTAAIGVNDRSLIVDESNYMWIFGGKSSSGIYTEQVWKGKLNILDLN
ncbi:DUF6242 domain-containing protein [Dysgonomonas sp. 520]|uniref:DUF6242 domain-containing protein n=1 Tax=Dysgonomonas sp. 520 TaxID=2302931 RepID=UPI0013D6EDC6|nr:DUF6242 domain-containing protein [Dysgonomonas sp. 520]NDW08783.1 hypothetical protein [Dysgonomonas sp. 520]